MEHSYKSIIDFLLENAGPSIRYRLKKDIMNTITVYEEAKLQ